MKKEINITCKGFKDVSVLSGGDIYATLQDVSPDFIDQLNENNIVSYADMNKVLDEMDYAEIVDYLEMKYDVKVQDLSKDVL